MPSLYRILAKMHDRQKGYSKSD